VNNIFIRNKSAQMRIRETRNKIITETYVHKQDKELDITQTFTMLKH